MIGGKFGQKKEIVIASLLLENSLPAVAERAGIGMSTLMRYLKDDDFQQEYQDAKQQALKQAISQLQSSASEAVNILREIARDTVNNASSRVTACKTILDGAVKSAELQDLEERLVKLEKKKAV